MAVADFQNSSNSEQIQIRFVTKQEQYAVANVPLSVPASIACKELNDLINGLIQESHTSNSSVDFDFIVDNELLRTTLKEHLQLKEISTENVLEVEYLERLSSPTPQDCMLHDDWVSSVHACGGFILSGCYDTSAHIWNDKGIHKLKIPGPKGAIKAVAWISQSEEDATFLIGGQDQTALQWRWNRKKNTADCLSIFRGHERSIESLAVNPDGSMFASGGWDTYLKIWSLSSDADSGESAPKKSKKDGGGYQSKTPAMTMKGHRDCLSCVRWTSKSEVLTSSWDHTLKIWDAEEGGLKQELAGNKSFLSCDRSPKSGLIIASSADKHVRLFDPRSTEGSVVKQTYSSHTLWVQAVRWSQTEENLFLSGAQDNMVKLWDTRSPRAPLFDLGGHTDKVFCCDWSMPEILVSGGSDNTVRVYSAPSTS